MKNWHVLVSLFGVLEEVKICYNEFMYNWSVDEKQLKKYPEKYKIWKLEQMINWGLGGEKLDEKLLRKYWRKLFLDPTKKRYLSFLLWSKS